MKFKDHQKLFLDIGGNKGESVRAWRNEHGDGWHIITFEPNPENFSSYDTFTNHTLIKAAAWTYDGDLKFFDNGSTNCLTSTHEMAPNSAHTKRELQLPCVDLNSWILKNCDEFQEIVVKMDIEGGEYELLPFLIKGNAIDLIQKFFVEWHSHRMIGGNKWHPINMFREGALSRVNTGDTEETGACDAYDFLFQTSWVVQNIAHNILEDMTIMSKHNQVLCDFIIKVGYSPSKWAPGEGVPVHTSAYMWDYSDISEGGYPKMKPASQSLNSLSHENTLPGSHEDWEIDRYDATAVRHHGPGYVLVAFPSGAPYHIFRNKKGTSLQESATQLEQAIQFAISNPEISENFVDLHNGKTDHPLYYVDYLNSLDKIEPVYTEE